MKSKKQLELTVPLLKRAPPLKYISLPLPTTQEVQNLRDFEIKGILGRGSEGTVYKALHCKSSSYYALKVISLTSHITREIDILRKVDSPYVVKCQGIFNQGWDINFVFEYMDGGSLADLLKHETRLSESTLVNVARQVLEGLKYLHSQSIAHRDIKPSNILTSKNLERIKIADFGVSRFVSPTTDPYCNSCVGTCAYMSPERFDPESYGGRYNGYAGDIWSLGLTLLECYVGHFPFLAGGEQADWPALMCAICFGEPPCAPASASAEFQSFIRCCLQKDADNRGTASQLLNHPFLNRASQFQERCSRSVSFHCLILVITSFDRLRILRRHRSSTF